MLAALCDRRVGARTLEATVVNSSFILRRHFLAQDRRKEFVMPAHLSLIAIPFAAAALAGVMAAQRQGDPEYTTDFGLEHCEALVPNGGNRYFSLEPGTVRRYEGDDEGEFVELEIKVTGQVVPITFEVNGHVIEARARVVVEREWIDGELVEVSRNYFARCSRTGNLFYLGEKVNIYKDGQIISHEGSWRAGEDRTMRCPA
jgi:hypothetical protein